MDSVIIFVIFYLSFDVIDLDAENDIPNNVIFERIDYENYNHSIITVREFKIKKVAYNVVNVTLSGIVHASFEEVWLHFVLYYKYNRYEQHLVNHWLDFCRYLKSPLNNPISRLVYENYLLFHQDIELNFLVSCPSPVGNLSARTIRPANLSNIVLPLLKAGRYRLNVMISSKQNGPIFFKTRIFASISDLRVWF